MYRKLNIKEKKWVERLMEAKFKGRDIIINQLLKSKVICCQEYSFISLKFKVEGKIEFYPYNVRVPVEMRAYQTKREPIIFLLHIVNGIVDELEILTIDLAQIDAKNIELEKVEYEINPEVVWKN